jgi:class 3 adenylate cyclase/tetratricopeptide (TPR) repeat protein
LPSIVLEFVLEDQPSGLAVDVTAWLDELGLGHYAEAFADNDIDGAMLTELTGDDLKELGVASLGHRKALLAAIAALRDDDGDLTSTVGPNATGEVVVADGERRQVTVLFCDLSGFTRLSSELGAEPTHRLLNRYFAAVDDIVHHYGGTVDKHIGDNVMAVFGAPIAHDDDPERAVRAALDIHPVVTNLGRQLGHDLQVHIGIASGEVVASGTGSDAHREYTVTGDTVNLASRLESLAGAGQTLVSEAVWRALAGRGEGDALGEIEVRGLRRAVAAWALRSLDRDPSGAGTGPIVGRRTELRQFAGILEACQETGTGHTVYVRGDAGIGKTRLVEELQTMARAAGFACHGALVLDFGAGRGQDAIRSMVRSLLELPVGADERQRADAAERAIAEELLGPERRIFLDDLLNLPQPPDLHAVYDAMDNATRNRGKRETVVELVEGLSRRRPLYLRFEDLHWADAIVLSHMGELARAIAGFPTLLTMTSRLEGDPMDGAWRGALRGTPLTTIDLGPLRETEARQLADGYAGANERFVATCIERADGNPLFLEQLLRSADVPSEERLPGSVQSVVLARMDRLGPADKHALQAASVIGQSFALDLLRHLFERPDYDCAGLVEHYLVRPRGDEFLFAHALIREGVYGSLLEGRRHELHRRAAAWFAERDPVLHAEHLDRAADPAAPRAHLEAARQQAEQNHDELALRLVERGLELAEDREERYDLMSLRARLLYDLGRPEPSIEAYQQALALADDDATRCRAWIGQVSGMRIVDRYDDALAILDQAQPLAERANLATDLARIHYFRGNIYFPLGRIDDVLVEHRQALDYARKAGSAEDEARALSGLGDAYYVRGRIVTAHDHFDQCMLLCREHGLAHIEVGSRGMRGTTRHLRGDLTGALEDRAGTVEMAARIGNLRAEMVARISLAWSGWFDLGDLAASRREAERALELSRRLGAGRFESLALAAMARGEAADGAIAEAREHARRAVEIARQTGMKFIGPWTLGVLAQLTEDSSERLGALDEAEGILHEGCVSHNYFYFCRDGVDLAIEMQDWDRALRYAQILENYTRTEPVAWSDFFVARGRALVAHHRGRRDEELMAELRRLRDEAAQIGLKIALPALEMALVAGPADPSARDRRSGKGQ